MPTAKELLTNLADSIRAKSGVTGTLSLAQMKTAVDGITTGINLPTLSNPASPADVRQGLQFINGSGGLQTGTMPNRGGHHAQINGLDTTLYTIPEGYHNGNGAVLLTDDIENILKSI